MLLYHLVSWTLCTSSCCELSAVVNNGIPRNECVIYQSSNRANVCCILVPNTTKCFIPRAEIIWGYLLDENNIPGVKEIEGFWGGDVEAPVTSVQMVLFCQADGTRKYESSVRLSPLTHSVFHRGHCVEKKTVSALKYIGWNETQEDCVFFSLWSDAFLNAWIHSLMTITIWSMANTVWKSRVLCVLISSPCLHIRRERIRLIKESRLVH